MLKVTKVIYSGLRHSFRTNKITISQYKFRPIQHIPKFYFQSCPTNHNNQDPQKIYQEGINKFDQGKYDESISLLQEFINSQNNTDPAKIEVVEANERIGSALYHQKKFKDSFGYFKYALETREKFFPDNKNEIIRDLNILAMLCDHSQQHQEAIEYNEKLLSIAKETLGENDPFIVNVCLNLGGLFEKTKNYSSAVDYYSYSLNLAKQRFGDHHPSLAVIYQNLGNAYMKMSEYILAVEEYLKCVEIITINYGENHASIPGLYLSISDVYRFQKKYQYALEFGLNALESIVKQYEPDHPSVLPYYLQIAVVYLEMRDFNKAIDFCEKFLTIQKSSGIENSKSALALSYIGTALDGLGNYNEGLKSHEKALNLALNASSCKKDDNSLSKIYFNLGQNYLLQKDLPKALENIEQSLKILKKIHGEDSENLLDCLCSLCQIYSEMGKFEEAIKNGNKAVRITKKNKKSKWNLAKALEYLGFAYYKQGDIETALDNLSESEAIRSDFFQSDHIEFLGLYNKILKIYEENKDQQKIAEYTKKLNSIKT